MGRGRREAARGVLMRLRRGPGAREADVSAAVDTELREIQENLEERETENKQSVFRVSGGWL